MGGYCGRLMAACAAMLSPGSGSLVISRPWTYAPYPKRPAIMAGTAIQSKTYLRVRSCQQRWACCMDWDERQRRSARLGAGGRVAGRNRCKVTGAGVPGFARMSEASRRVLVSSCEADWVGEGNPRAAGVSSLPMGGNAGSDKAEGVPAGLGLVDSARKFWISQVIGE